MPPFDKNSSAEDASRGVDLSGKTALVTGVNSGIGFETMRVLALRGAHVIGTARTQAKAAEAARRIDGTVTPLECELEDPASIRACAAAVEALGKPLDICIANAGIMALPKLERVNGIEKQFATNHLGHYLLIRSLQAQIEAARSARVVIVSSAAHVQAPAAGIEFDNLSGERDYRPWRAYGQSKLANILFAKTLATRLPSGRTANALHPGVIATNLARHMNPLLAGVANAAMRLFSKSVAQGAATSCYVATRPELSGITGQYFSDCALIEPSRLARDDALAQRLWETSAKLVGLEP
jgi:NAD(P)-dependent dehydrogenase (short-subunit alcohol dehydrogenase family)